MLRLLVPAVFVLFSLPLRAGEFQVQPFVEAVASVRDAAAVAETLREVGGWELRSQQPVDSNQLRAWGLAEAEASQWLLGPAQARQGALRLLQFEGVTQRRIRPFDQPWDTGGLFDVNVRVNDMPAFYRALEVRQWHAVTEPVHLEAFGHTQWLPRGPDGVRISPIERPGGEEAFPELAGPPGSLSRAFNATQVVRDLDAAVAFYRDVLGFEQVIDRPGTRLGQGPNVFGLPYDQAAQVSLPFTVLSPDDSGRGTLELIRFEGAVGRDFSARAEPPNLGMLMLRFPVQGLEALAAHLAAREIEILYDIDGLDLPPYGDVRLLAVRGPEGLWLEFFERD